MEFRILGPLEIDHGGQVIRLRGRRARSLLATLLLDAGEVVPADRLMDRLWGDDWPASGGAALRMRVSQLRKVLESARAEPGGEPLLVAEPPGYVLHVQPDDIDARRFERLAVEGRRALAESRPEQAAASLRDALSLWRGPALAGLGDEPGTRMEAARLEEQRDGALEDRVDADLALGRHIELVAELQAHVSEEPLRERRHGQLMLALYRSGRQAEALAAYRQAREVLVGELGVEPGRALAELEIGILRQEPALELDTAASAPTPRADSPPAGELKLVTVLVCELDEALGGLGETDDLERTVAQVERYHGAMASEAEAAGGGVETLAGEARMAIFGAPVAQEDHAQRALGAALAMRRRLREVGGDADQLRVGIDAGPAVVGGGASTRGSTVASAARLQRGAAPGDILVGERAAAAVGGAFEFGPPTTVETLRTPAGLPCRPLIRALVPTSPRSPGGPGAFVGREQPLEGLRAAFRRVAADERPHLVTVVGDAGVGKSRLVGELWGWLATQTPPSLRRTGRCQTYGAGVTYRPLAEVLREQLGLLETDSPEIIRVRLGERPILGLTLGLDVAPALHPLAAREQLQEAWVALLGELVAEQPVVVLIEDLQWAHDPLLDLLERLTAETPGPLLIVGTARPEFAERRPSWGQSRAAATIRLEPLKPVEATRLLDDIAAGELSVDVRRLVLERAEGNPFFLEELLAGLLDQGLAGPDAQLPDATAAVPDSVRALLAARIDLLAPTEKAALRAASVIGRSFWQGAVRELLGGAAPDFAVLEGRDFIRSSPTSALAGEREFAFKHALTREVAYAGLTTPTRARQHAAFAAWLEIVAEGRDEHAAPIAHHYAAAVAPEHTDLAWRDAADELGPLRERAILWLRRAAELGMRRYELDGALVLLRRALALETEATSRAELWRATAHAHALGYDGEAFWRAIHEAIELSSKRPMLAELYAELAFETSTRAGVWRRQPGGDLVDGWIDRALALAEPSSAARARALIARCYWAPGDSAEAASEAIAISERLDDAGLLSYALDGRGIAAFSASEVELGMECENRRFELLDRISDPDHIADIYHAPLTGCVWSGQFTRAELLLDRYVEITSTLTPHHRLHGVAVPVEIEELRGGWPAIHELTEEATAVVHASRDTPCVRGPRALLVCALAATQLGEDGRAAELEEYAQEVWMEGYGHVLDTPLMRLALGRGDLALVERILARPLPDRGWHRGWLMISTESARLDALAALGRRHDLESWPPAPAGTYLEPFHLRALGVVHEDSGLLEQALDRFRALGLDWHAGQTGA